MYARLKADMRICIHVYEHAERCDIRGSMHMHVSVNMYKCILHTCICMYVCKNGDYTNASSRRLRDIVRDRVTVDVSTMASETEDRPTDR
jgi:hypothetical protein